MTDGFKGQTFRTPIRVRQHTRGGHFVRAHTRGATALYSPPHGQRPIPPSEVEGVVRAAIRSLSDAWGIDPDNSKDVREWFTEGGCQDLAVYLNELLPGSQVIYFYQTISDAGGPAIVGLDGGAHVVVKYHGMYYDGETPQGVVEPYELPYFDRQWVDDGTSIDQFAEKVIRPTTPFREVVRQMYGPMNRPKGTGFILG